MQSAWHKDIDVAIIMDGNGRWATRRGLPRRAGHRVGISALRSVVEAARLLPVRSLTVYAFSADNWKRPAREISALFGLLRYYLARELATLVENDVRLTVIGRRDRLPDDIVAHIAHAESVTKTGRRLHLRIAFDYSARHAIAQAADQTGAAGATSETSLAKALCPDNGPANIDFLIRTGGEQRLSDFLLWEAAYAELFFSDRLWPDFDGCAFAAAIAEFDKRNRRFGGLPDLQSPDGELERPSIVARCAKHAIA